LEALISADAMSATQHAGRCSESVLEELHTMKKTLCTIALTGLLGLGMTAFAQDQSTTSPPPMHGPRGQGFSPDNQLEHLTKALNLSSDQQTQIKPILENQQTQMMQLHQDQSLSRADKMTKAKSLHADTTSKIEAVLNDQQKQKYEAMQQQMEERRQQHMQGGGDAQPQAQPQQ
jgi:Spy/CpxP family protein refolding chaperone